MKEYNKGYYYIFKNRFIINDTTYTSGNDNQISESFVLNKGCWIIEISLTFYVNTSGVYAFFIKMKDEITSTFINTTQQYWGALTSTGSGLNHTVKLRQIISIDKSIKLVLFINWINFSTSANVALRGTNSFANFIRYIKIG